MSTGTTYCPVTPASDIHGGRFYRPELDVLRFFAFLGVFVFHAAPRGDDFYRALAIPNWLIRILLDAFGAGSYGVDLFFALSAYLITSLLLQERASAGTVNLLRFYIRRILRIWPLYLSFVLLAALLPYLTHGPRLSWRYIIGYTLLAGNWTYVLYGLPASVAIPLWTVSIEEQFYLSWPLVIRRASVQRMAKLAVGLLLVANLFRAVLAVTGATTQTMEYSTFTRLDPIALGILIALLGNRLPKFATWHRLSFLFAGLAIWISVSAFCFPDRPENAGSGKLVLGFPLTAVASVAILLSVMSSSHPFLKNPLLVYLGKISYGLYIFHMLALSGAARLIHGTSPLVIAGRVGIGLSLTILLAAASYRWLESPFLRLKDRLSRVKSRPI